MIDVQFDFYHPLGIYGRAARPTAPFREAVSQLKQLTSNFSRVIRIGSTYSPEQWPDMPNLCATPRGRRWHPELCCGPLLFKSTQSAYPQIEDYFTSRSKLVLAGFCTHRCVKSTLEDLLAAGWQAAVVASGVASCGLRRQQHFNCLKKWQEENLIFNKSARYVK